MKVLPRTQFGNPILRAKSKKIPIATIKTSTFKNLIKDMTYTMHRVHGVGLAAPQIGKSISLAVVGVKAMKFKRVVINPKITWHSKKKLMDWEGCLSFPDGRGEVPRWSEIIVEYTNETGKKIKEKHIGFIARVFQHEIDHLNGLVYIDRMIDMKTMMTYQEFIKRIIK